MAPRKPKDTEKKPAKTVRAKSAAKPEAEPTLEAAPVPVEVAAPGSAVKLKDLIDSVATATGGRKAEVKATVEATLSALRDALASGQALAVPPLGKLRVVKTKGPALTLKLRVAEGGKAAGLALADDGQDS